MQRGLSYHFYHLWFFISQGLTLWPKLAILSQLPQCWDYRNVSLQLTLFVKLVGLWKTLHEIIQTLQDPAHARPQIAGQTPAKNEKEIY